MAGGKMGMYSTGSYAALHMGALMPAGKFLLRVRGGGRV
jgi:hypothetical protein